MSMTRCVEKIIDAWSSHGTENFISVLLVAHLQKGHYIDLSVKVYDTTYINVQSKSNQSRDLLIEDNEVHVKYTKLQVISCPKYRNMN